MKPNKKEVKKMVEAMKQADTAGWVCDSLNVCDGWKAGEEFFDPVNADWKSIGCFQWILCPWCGRSLDWGNWERLKK